MPSSQRPVTRPAHRDRKGMTGHSGHKVFKALQELRVQPGRKGLLELLGRRDLPDLKVRRANKGLQDPMERESRS